MLWGTRTSKRPCFIMFYFDDYHYLQSRISVFHVMCHNESTALTFNNVDQRDHRWRNQCLYCRTNVKELNSVYFLLSCLVGATTGTLGLTNLAGFLFFFMLLLFSVPYVSACWCVQAAQNHGGALINDTASFVILLIICLMEDSSRPYYPGTQYLGTSSSAC